MGSLFKSKKVKETSEQELPRWLRQQYKTEFQRGDQLWDDAQTISDQLNRDPREVLGPSGMEQEAITDMLAGFEGVEGDLGGIYDKLMGSADSLSMFDPSRSIEDIRAGYESEYTDDVVDTTLAGMDRKREQERARNEAAAAATGGISNTRRAVSEAIGDNLFGMDRAAMEAQLRDDAYTQAATMGQNEAGLALNQESTRSDILGGAGGLQGQLAQLLETAMGAKGAYGAMERGLSQQQLDEERTNSQQQLDWLQSVYGNTRADKPGGVGTTTQTGKGASTGQQILGTAASLAGAWLSDEDAKEIDDKGLLEDGPGALDTVHKMAESERYTYKPGMGHRPDPHSGMIAQRLEKANPDLVIVDPESGLRQVDGAVVMTTIASALAEVDRKLDKWTG